MRALLAAPVHATPVANAVVAFADTGIDPYHVAFRDPSPRAYRHPSTYLPGYPKNAEALRITLDEPDYRTAVRKDCERVWKRVRPGRLYWFPGTKIVGAVTFRAWPALDCASFPVRVPILDDDQGGHGTMVASRGAGNGYGACPACRVVAVEGEEAGMGWIAANASWIDVASHSWGLGAPVYTPSSAQPVHTYDPSFVRRIEDASRAMLSFWAAGNGVATQESVVAHPTVLDPRLTPSAIAVGGHDSGYVTPWSDAPPDLAADACDSTAAWNESVGVSTDDRGGGTSGATPWAAGGAARALLTARRLLGDTTTGVRNGVYARGRRGRGPLADGVLTMAELRRVVLATATPRPKGDDGDGPACTVTDFYETVPVRYADLPAAYPEYLTLGYGAVDRASMRLADAVLAGVAMPDRSGTDAWYAVQSAARQATYDAYTAP